MKKDRAIELLGGTPKKAAEAMGYRAVQTIYLWPDELPQATTDRVLAAWARQHVKNLPAEFRHKAAAYSSTPAKELGKPLTSKARRTYRTTEEVLSFLHPGFARRVRAALAERANSPAADGTPLLRPEAAEGAGYD